MDKKKPRKRREVNYEYGDPRITVRAVFSYGHRKYEEYYIAKTGGIKAIKYDEFGAYTGTLPPEEVPVLGDFFQATAEPMKDQPPGTIKRLNEWMHEGMEPPQGPLSKKQRQEDHNGGLV